MTGGFFHCSDCASFNLNSSCMWCCSGRGDMANCFCCSVLQVVSETDFAQKTMARWTRQPLLHSSTEQRVPFAPLVTDCFRDGNCRGLLPLFATLPLCHPVTRPGIRRVSGGGSCRRSCMTLHSQLYTRSKIAIPRRRAVW